MQSYTPPSKRHKERANIFTTSDTLTSVCDFLTIFDRINVRSSAKRIHIAMLGNLFDIVHPLKLHTKRNFLQRLKEMTVLRCWEPEKVFSCGYDIKSFPFGTLLDSSLQCHVEIQNNSSKFGFSRSWAITGFDQPEASSTEEMIELFHFFKDHNTHVHIKRLAVADFSCLEYLNHHNMIPNIERIQKFKDKNGITSPSNLSSLSNLKNLRHISGVCDSLQGNISSLSSLTQLITIDFFMFKHMVGDLSSFASLIHLEHLDIYSNIQGNLSSLKRLINLKYLYLGKAVDITGNLNDLHSMVNLNDLVSPSIRGDVSVLSSLRALKSIFLMIPSPPSNFSSLSHLNSISFGGRPMGITEPPPSSSSSSSSLVTIIPSNMHRLKMLSVENDPLSIDSLTSLSCLVNLKRLTIKHCKRTMNGSLTSLQSLTTLRKLVIASSSIRCNLEVFSNLSNLLCLEISEQFDLRHLIEGDIASLTNVPQLMIVIFTNANIFGDIMSLVGLTKLLDIQLVNTHVSQVYDRSMVSFTVRFHSNI